jgi:hypothetical protein
VTDQSKLLRLLPDLILVSAKEACGFATEKMQPEMGMFNEKKIAPHIPVIDKSKRRDGTLSREDFAFDKDRNVYVCPPGKLLHTTGKKAGRYCCPDLNAITIFSPVFNSLSLTTLLGFLDFRICALCRARSFRSR